MVASVEATAVADSAAATEASDWAVGSAAAGLAEVAEVAGWVEAVAAVAWVEAKEASDWVVGKVAGVKAEETVVADCSCSTSRRIAGRCTLVGLDKSHQQSKEQSLNLLSNNRHTVFRCMCLVK